jgi:hypothetical protein
MMPGHNRTAPEILVSKSNFPINKHASELKTIYVLCLMAVWINKEDNLKFLVFGLRAAIKMPTNTQP